MGLKILDSPLHAEYEKYYQLSYGVFVSFLIFNKLGHSALQWLSFSENVMPCSCIYFHPSSAHTDSWVDLFQVHHWHNVFPAISLQDE